MADAVPFRVRPAGADDIDALLALENDPDKRAMSHPRGPLTKNAFSERFEAAKTNVDGPRWWVLERDGQVVAFADYRRVNADAIEVNYAVASTFRRRGYGEALLRASLPEALAAFSARQVVATAFIDNLPSRALLTKLGFSSLGEQTKNNRGFLLFRLSSPVLR